MLELCIVAMLQNPATFLATPIATQSGGDREPVVLECYWSFSNLAAGKYIARLLRPDGSGGSAEVTVSAGTFQIVAIPAPVVTVFGIVTLWAAHSRAQ